ncbi:hypothetical protein IAQ61_011763 [Plenodomus lingam]|uniref:uncharacterized protein n=1 Tax=Leptosphaeria maculans TaxID=5022 RepID=UPI00331F125D|nr:hypothetical protein IAQ61_011763 [Plenodomus lingam]
MDVKVTKEATPGGAGGGCACGLGNISVREPESSANLDWISLSIQATLHVTATTLMHSTNPVIPIHIHRNQNNPNSAQNSTSPIIHRCP